MRLSLVVGLYNMQREIPRSLSTMSARHQQVSSAEYEIILVDNGSASAMDEAALAAIADNVRYIYVDNASPSPTNAINQAVEQSRGDLVTVVIDGARMFSPGILARTFEAAKAFDDPFVYAPSLHLGPQLQNDSSYGGYDQGTEDDLLASVGWRDNGYELFSISNVDAVPERLAKPTFESNCFTVRRSTWDRIGGYHPGFAQSTGGGLANWELFGRYMRDREITPVLLIGEATFHQFHGGASTNQPRAGHPIRTWLQEHIDIFGEPYAWPSYEPVLFGQARQAVTSSLYEHNVQAQVALLRSLAAAGEHDAAIAIGRQLCARFPNDPAKMQILAESLEKASRRAEASEVLDRALEIAPTQAELHVSCGVVHVGLGRNSDARASYETAIELDDLLPEAFFHRAHLELREHDYQSAVRDFERALALEPNPPLHYQLDLDRARGLQRTSVDAEPLESASAAGVDAAGIRDRFLESVRRTYDNQFPYREIDEHALGGSFSTEQLQVLQQIVYRAAPTRVLVVGAFLGLSTQLMVDATETYGASVVAVDPNLRHRIFSEPLDHARTFVTSDRVQFLQGFFGARTSGGTLFDLQEFEPSVDETRAHAAIASVPVVEPTGLFDLVLIDADGGTEAEIAAAVMPLLAADARVIFVGIHNNDIAGLLAYGLPDSTIEEHRVEPGDGFVVATLRRPSAER